MKLGIESKESKSEGTDISMYHSIKIFDENGNVLDRVLHFDTETLLCTFGKRRQVVAAGFCFCAAYEHDYNELLRFLPAGLLPFVVTDVFDENGDYVDKKFHKKRVDAYIANYLDSVPKGHLEKRKCKSDGCTMCYPKDPQKTAPK